MLDQAARVLGIDTNVPGCGGGAIERRAALGDPTPYRTDLAASDPEPGCGLAFGGLLRRVLSLVAVARGRGDASVSDLCAALQEAIADRLVLCTERALALCASAQGSPSAVRCLILSGGVAANACIRDRLQRVLSQHNVHLACPPRRLCTDNAVMVAYAAGLRLLRAPTAPLHMLSAVCLEHERPLGKDISSQVIEWTARWQSAPDPEARAAAAHPLAEAVDTGTRMLNGDSDVDLDAAAAALRRHELVAFPTETVYGLGADAFSPIAVRRVYEAKGRPSDNPLIVHVADDEQFKAIAGGQPAEVEAMVRTLRARFMPGPFSVVVRNNGHRVASTVPRDTVVLRMPDSPIAMGLIRRAGPLAAPSANVSGRPSPTTAAHVAHDFEGRGVWAVVDGGPCQEGVESTVLDCTCFPPAVLREGPTTRDQIWRALGLDRTCAGPATAGGHGAMALGASAVPRSPGAKYRHYAPSCPFVVVEGDRDALDLHIDALKIGRGKRVAVIATEGEPVSSRACKIWYCLLARGPCSGGHGLCDACLGECAGPCEQARARALAFNLYAALRGLDRPSEVDVILMRATSTDTDMGPALMERAVRAADGKIVRPA